MQTNESIKGGKQIYNCCLDNRTDNNCVYCMVNEYPDEYMCWLDALISIEED